MKFLLEGWLCKERGKHEWEVLAIEGRPNKKKLMTRICVKCGKKEHKEYR